MGQEWRPDVVAGAGAFLYGPAPMPAVIAFDLDRVLCSSEPFLSGIILAAGTATRMGQPKQLLLLDGRPLLQHVIDGAAASCLDEIVVVLGHCADEIAAAIRCPPRGRIVVNAAYAEGQSSSLRAGLRTASERAVAAAVLLGDQPGVAAALIDRIAEASLSSRANIVRPVYTDAGGRRVPGHPVVLARGIWREVEALRGDQGARALLREHPEWLVEVPMAGEPPRDIDTPEDYRYTTGTLSPPR